MRFFFIHVTRTFTVAYVGWISKLGGGVPYENDLSKLVITRDVIFFRWFLLLRSHHSWLTHPSSTISWCFWSIRGLASCRQTINLEHSSRYGPAHPTRSRGRPTQLKHKKYPWCPWLLTFKTHPSFHIQKQNLQNDTSLYIHPWYVFYDWKQLNIPVFFSWCISFSIYYLPCPYPSDDPLSWSAPRSLLKVHALWPQTLTTTKVKRLQSCKGVAWKKADPTCHAMWRVLCLFFGGLKTNIVGLDFFELSW